MVAVENLSEMTDEDLTRLALLLTREAEDLRVRRQAVNAERDRRDFAALNTPLPLED